MRNDVTDVHGDTAEVAVKWPPPRCGGPRRQGCGESDEGPALPARVVQVPRLRFLAARTVSHGQQSGNGQHQPVATHADQGSPRSAAFSYHTRVPDRFEAPEALLNPVAAGIQVGFRLRHRRVGQQHPGLRLTVGLPRD